ncbi:MAG: ATP-binding cassette domain-containing protein [Bacteroidota bacterium]
MSLEIRPKETLVLLGLSGSGKTTLLKLINRLIEPNSGSIKLDNQPIEEKEKHELRRKIGYVIQDSGLLPHLNVRKNIGIVSKISGNQIKVERILELLDLIGLDEGILDKYPNQLSGGQKQRVGIARALANDPPIILMDEPFSALDNITRNQLQDDFLNLDSLKDKTIVLVTHDVQEAFKLADRIALLEKGVLQQLGTPQELISNPANDFVRSFFAKDKLTLYLQSIVIEGKALTQHLSNKSLDPDQKNEVLLDALKNYQP